MSPINRCIIVFAKAPEPGAVKRRLIPNIGAETAANLQARMLENGITTAINAGLADVQLWCTPNCQHPLFHSLSQRFALTLHAQQGNDLGERMYNAFESALANYRQVVLVGTDCPFISVETYHLAFSALSEGNDAIIAPAYDGGYVLLGLLRNDWRLFENISWGSGQVCDDTCARLNVGGFQWQALETYRDIDHYEDLLYLKSIAKTLVKTKAGQLNISAELHAFLETL